MGEAGVADLPGDMGGPSCQVQGPLSLQTAWGPPHPHQKCWGVPRLPGAPTEETTPCALPKPCVPKVEKTPGVPAAVSNFLKPAKGREHGTQPTGATSGQRVGSGARGLHGAERGAGSSPAPRHRSLGGLSLRFVVCVTGVGWEAPREGTAAERRAGSWTGGVGGTRAPLCLPRPPSLLSPWEGGRGGKRAPGAVPEAQTHRGLEMSRGLASVRCNPLDAKEECVRQLLGCPLPPPLPVSCLPHPPPWGPG